MLIDTVKNNKTAKNFLGTLESLHCFIRLSNCRNTLFHKLQQEFRTTEIDTNEDESDDPGGSLTIKKLCETRWACRYVDFLSFVIEESTTPAKGLSDARGLIHQIKSFEFLLAMVVLKPLFEHTNVVSKYLQSIQIDLGAAVSSVNATLSVLKGDRNSDKFKEYFEIATSLAHRFKIEIPTIRSTRKRTISHRLDDMWLNEHQHETVESKYRGLI